MKTDIKQSWSRIPHINKTNNHSTQKDHDIWHGNPDPCFGQTRSCGLFKNLVDQRNRET
jgi:hypothetical protein